MKRRNYLLGLCALLIAAPVIGTSAARAGGGGGGTETIKVSKCYYIQNGYVLVKASSTNTSAHIYLYLPNGQFLGETQNGGGQRYGGSSHYVGYDPGYITFVSSAGARLDAPTAPFQL